MVLAVGEDQQRTSLDFAYGIEEVGWRVKKGKEYAVVKANLSVLKEGLRMWLLLWGENV